MSLELESFVVVYRDLLYVTRNHAHGHWTLTGFRYCAFERPDRPDTDDLENIAESLGVSVTDLSVVKRIISEFPSKPAFEIPFLAEAGLAPEWCKKEVQKHIDAGHNLTDVTTLDSDRIRFLCSCGVGLMGGFKRHPKV